MDRIELRGITARGFHGVLEDERRKGQDFIVDVILGVDTAPAASFDDLNHTVDYSDVALSVAEIIKGDPVNLIETLAARIADAVLMRPLVRCVEVTVHKPHAPIAVKFADVYVTIMRIR